MTIGFVTMVLTAARTFAQSPISPTRQSGLPKSNPELENQSGPLSAQTSPFQYSVQQTGFVNDRRSTEKINLRLRIAWGGGAARQWRGTIEISDGHLQDLVPHSIESTSSAKFILRRENPPSSTSTPTRVIEINQSHPRKYDALDITVTTSRQASITINLFAVSDPQTRFQVQKPISFFIDRGTEQNLDQRGNRGQVRRIAGDNLRIAHQRQHLVFQPNESFDLTLVPHELGESKTGNYQYELDVLTATDGLTIHHQQHSVSLARPGAFPLWEDIKIPIPSRSGVYNIRLTVLSKRFPDTIVRTTPVATRVIQIVVTGGKSPTPPVTTQWKEIARYNPADPTWWQRLREIDPTEKIKILAGSSPSTVGFLPFGNRQAEKIQHQESMLTRVASGGWQALPLKVENPQRPHLLEVEYPNDIQQTMAISILEPNALGKIGPLGIDSGVHLGNSQWETAPATLVHRILFWPQTHFPMLVIRNQSPSNTVTYGQIRIKQLQGNLSELHPLPASKSRQRLALAYFNKPLFTENFSSREAAGPQNTTTLDDWTTFFEGGRRLVNYLQFAGNNGAIINVLSEGGSLFPSELFHSTPKYDSGAFFPNGQDPSKKDVLEMLFRMFDQQQLTLIPSIQLNMPLHELELQLEQPETAEGIRLTQSSSSGSTNHTSVLYNPLDPRVQTAVGKLVQEITKRYGDHPSFGGVNIELTPDSYTHLPSSQWGQDPTTLDRFFQHQEIKPSPTHADNLNALQGNLARDWKQWKFQQISKFYRTLALELEPLNVSRTKDHSDAVRLYLCTAELYESPDIQRQVYPTLPPRNTLTNITKEMSIDPMLTREVSNLVWFTPHKANPVIDPVSQNVDIQLNQSSEIQHLFASSELHGTVFFHTPTTAQLPQLDQQSPWGADHTHTWFANTLTPSHFYNRQRFVSTLAISDCRVLADGGWLLPLGQEDHLRALLHSFQQLPDSTFETVRLKENPIPQPLIIRRFVQKNKTFLYILNHAPWAATAQVDLKMPANGVPTPLGQNSKSSFRWHPRGATWQLVMEPFDFIAIRIDHAQAEVMSAAVQFNKQVIPQLQQHILDVNRQLGQLQQPSELTPIKNAGFEAPITTQNIPGWLYNSQSGNSVTIRQNAAKQGSQYMAIHRPDLSRQILWVRSESFPVPQTGRIAFSVWMRTPNPAQPPSVRLAIEGRLHGQVYYRPRTIGREEPDTTTTRQPTPLTDKWMRYVLVVDDLPVQGMTDLRVGFDLISPGKIEIDNLQIFDLWFQPREYRELMKDISLAYSYQNRGRVADSYQFLHAFWPRYISSYAPPPFPRVAKQLDESIQNEPPDPGWPPLPNVLQQFKDLPTILFPF